ncbi:hypothetical protein Tco_0558601 [Tanacetum coccineum]
MYHSLNQLQWQLERDNFHGHVSKTCLVVLRTQFKEFFDSKEVNASDVPNKCRQKSFSDDAEWETKNFRSLLLQYLEELDKLIHERAFKYGELQIKESEVQAIKEIKNCLKESEIQQQENLVTEGTTLEACLATEGRSKDENRSSDKESNGSEGNDTTADIGPLYDSDTLIEAPHSSNDTFEIVFAHGIQIHEQPESILDTYEVNENNNNIIFDIPNMDPDRYKEEHDDFAYEQQRAFFASLINNLKCDVQKSAVESESGEKNILLENETSSFETKIKELEMTLAQQTKDFEDAKVDFSKKTDKFESYFEKLEKTKVVLERQLDPKDLTLKNASATQAEILQLEKHLGDFIRVLDLDASVLDLDVCFEDYFLLSPLLAPGFVPWGIYSVCEEGSGALESTGTSKLQMAFIWAVKGGFFRSDTSLKVFLVRDVGYRRASSLLVVKGNLSNVNSARVAYKKGLALGFQE